MGGGEEGGGRDEGKGGKGVFQLHWMERILQEKEGNT